MNLNLILVSAIAVINLTLILASSVPRKIVVAVDGGTESIRACCFDDCGNIVGKSCAIPYETYHEQPGFAEQDPADWWNNMGQAVRGALASVEEEFELGETTSKEWSFSNWVQNVFGAEEPAVEKVDVRSLVAAICIDTTCCSVVVLDENHKPLRKSLLWMDARSAPQTVEIMKKAKGDKALKVNCNGNGPISAEWMTPKCMWIKQNENSLYKKAKYICEYQDYMNYKMTGVMCASSCNAAARWHWDGEKCIDTTKDKYAGRPMSLYKKLGMLDLADKLPQVCLPMGSLVGRLTQEAADHLGLLTNTPVAQGGPDAFVGMVGLGCIHSQQLCLITGSSHLHCVVTSKPLTANGSWGAYKGAPLPGINFAEGGQSSTGSLSRWAKKLFGAQELSYKTLDDEAESIAPGSDGLIALETFQGSRTPVTDPLARGALVGLTLSHSRGHIWRALMEAVCLGTRACIDGLESAGHTCSEIIIAGGTTRSPLWLQMHADVTGKPVILCENIDAPLLGCAILACVGCGIHASVEDAVRSMVRVSRRVEPDPIRQVIYDKLYNEVYTKLSPAVRPVVHSISKLRGGGQSDIDLTVSPSILAADWADMKSEIRKCVDAGLLRIHTDVFDGVYIDSPNALTFGPQMVKAIRSVSSEIIIDIHLCVDRPDRYIESLAEAGANRVIFMLEAVDQEGAVKMAKAIRQNGMQAGISLNPSTAVDSVFPLLDSGLFDTVDLLAVQPGFGGQKLQESVLGKIQDLKLWINQNNHPVKIMVDGGVNEKTSAIIRKSGADILVAGTFLFQHAISIAEGAKELRL